MFKRCVYNAETGEKSEKELTPLTLEEIAEMERLQAETPEPEKTQEERLSAVEEQVGILNIILGGDAE